MEKTGSDKKTLRNGSFFYINLSFIKPSFLLLFLVYVLVCR